MKNSLLLVGSVGLIVVLAVAAFSPATTYEVLSTPKRWQAEKERAERKEQMRAYWSEIKARVDEGDASAMYELGRQMKGWSNEEWTGVRSDSAAGAALVRAAADKGHIDALLTVWSAEKHSRAELLAIASKALDKGDDGGLTLAGVSFVMQQYALDECDRGIRDAAEDVHAALVRQGSEMLAGFEAQFAAFREVYATECAV